MPISRVRYNWFDISNEERDIWESICPVFEYRIADPMVLSGVLPNALIKQYTSVFIMASGTSSGNVYYMANGNRIDFSDNAIDQMPFGLAFVGSTPIPSGCLIQHGDWFNRTTYPPNEFWELISASGIAHYYPLSELPIEHVGSITVLNIQSQESAFKTLVDALKDQVEE